MSLLQTDIKHRDMTSAGIYLGRSSTTYKYGWFKSHEQADRADLKDQISDSCGSQHGSIAEHCKGWLFGARVQSIACIFGGLDSFVRASSGWTYLTGQFWRRLTAARSCCGCSLLQAEGDVNIAYQLTVQ